jgi:rod shape determining protein RodA
MPHAIRRISHFFTAHVDGLLLGAVLLIMATGLAVLFSASNASLPRVSSQALNMLVALGVMWVFANIPPHYLMRLSLPVYVLGLVLLVGVALFGEVVNGARRWLNVGVTRIQPSAATKRRSRCGTMPWLRYCSLRRSR